MRRVPRYLWPEEHQRTGQPFGDPEPVRPTPYKPEAAGPHEHHEPLCEVCEAHLRKGRDMILEKYPYGQRAEDRKAIGYWSGGPVGTAYPELANLPDPLKFVDTSWDEKEKKLVIDYVREGAVLASWRGMSACRFCNHLNGNKCFFDEKFVWPQGFAHYLEKHGVRPPQEFVDHVLAQLVKKGK